MNHIQGCFRAAIAINVAVSCVLGRVGIFQIVITLWIGIFGYQLNRRVCTDNFGDDAFGSMYIFAFGGFMGLAMGLILRFKDRKHKFTAKHKYFDSTRFTVILGLLGSAILLITLPFLAHLHHKNFNRNAYLFYSPALSLLFSSSEGLMGSILISLIAGRDLKARDLINGPIAGAIIGGASSYYTANIAYCMGVGLIGGTIQGAVQFTLQKKFAKSHRPISTISFCLFGIQGFLGSIAAAIGKKIIESNSQNLPYVNLGPQSVKLFIFGLVSSSMGFVFGIVIGLLCYFVNFIPSKGYFNDFYEWKIMSDMDEVEKKQTKPQPPRAPHNSNPPQITSSSSLATLKPDPIIDVPY